jgi:EmrB/QacA subfamily drug resistance transporter
MSEVHESTAGEGEEPDPRRWIALATLLLAGFMNLMDLTIVNVALPRFEQSLGASSSQIEWVVAGYVVAFALGLLPFGRLGDIVGRRRMYLLGVAAFTFMSAACGLAPNIELLVAARFLQGLSAAMMMPHVLAITQNIFPAHERALAFSYFGLSASLAAVSGPLFGGLLISADLFGLDWRPIFLINLPIGVFALIAGLRLIPSIKGNADLTNDWVGIVFACAALLFIVFPLVEGRSFGWPLWIFVMLAAAVPATVLLVAWERHRERQDRSQLLPMTLIRNRNYLLGIGMTMIFFSGVPGFFMVVALFLQSGFGFTPFESGVATMFFPVGVFSASFMSGRLGGRWLKPRLMAGAVILASGMIGARQVFSGVTDAIGLWDLALPLFIAGLGMGLTIAVLFQSVLTNVPSQDSGSGAGALQAFQQMGIAIGVAFMGQIFFAVLAANGGGHASYVAAIEQAMIFTIVAFALFLVLSVFLKIPRAVPPPARVLPAEF